VVSHHFAGLLLVDPVRAVSAAHDPGVHRRFTRASKPKFRWLLLEKLRDSRDAFLPFEAFPPPIAVVAGTLRRCLATRAVHAGRLSPPARLSPCSAARLASSLEARESCRPEGPLNLRSKRSRASKVHQPPYRLVVRPGWEVAFPSDRDLAVFLHRRVRCATAVSSDSYPVLPWAWAPTAFADGSQYVKDRFLRTRLSAC